MIDPAAIPVIPRGVRIHHDKVRDMWVLLAPERTITLDAIGQAILNEINGTASFAEIVDSLAAKYNAPAPEIAKDVAGFITGLTNRRILDLIL